MNFEKIYSAMTLCVLLLTQGCTAAKPENTLLPEVAQIVLNTPKPSPASLKQDVFVGLLALDTPEGMDYMDIGSQVVQTNFETHKRSIQTQTHSETSDYSANHYNSQKPLRFNLAINGKDYVFLCAEQQAMQCAIETLADNKAIATLVHNNSVLIKRYQQVRRLPEYGTYFYNGVNGPLPSYHEVLWLSRLQVAQAIIAFGKGDGDTGFALLSEEMAFARRMLSQDQTLIGKMIAIALLNSHVKTISSLLDLPQMQPYLNDKRLQNVLIPLSETEQKVLGSALQFERNVYLSFLYTQIEDREAALAGTKYNRYNTTNTEYLRWQAEIERASLSLSEASALYTQGKLPPLDEEVALLRKQYPLRDDNPFGKTMFDTSPRPSNAPYILKFYDLQSQIALARIKYQIVQAGIPAKNIPAFLQEQGKQAKNPLTQQPFEWDAQTQILSTLRQDKRKSERVMVWIKG